MEIGAVMGAAPRRAVQRLNSDPGDKIILLGGRTGRDGIGGATGSSKAHNTKSTSVCGAEVQKGNAPTERKLQRLFRREEVSHIIKKCNDFEMCIRDRVCCPRDKDERGNRQRKELKE